MSNPSHEPENRTVENLSAAIEAERRHMARLLQENVIAQLNLLLVQANVYEQTASINPQGHTAISVLSALIRQVLQQARDLETGLRPTLLESLGLEPALEALASQQMRSRGLQLSLSLQRLRERLLPHIELALFRATQEAIDRAVRQGNASHIAIRLEKTDDELVFSVIDNGLPPTGEILRSTRQRIETLGGLITFQSGQHGGLEMVIRFMMQAPVKLTEREMDVIRLVAEGLTNKAIGARLCVSPRTVKFHLDNIYSKLGVKTRTEAAVYALSHGWTRNSTGETD